MNLSKQLNQILLSITLYCLAIIHSVLHGTARKKYMFCVKRKHKFVFLSDV